MYSSNNIRDDRDSMGNYKLTISEKCFLYTICGMLFFLFLLGCYVIFAIIFETFMAIIKFISTII